jgi:uncharacterized protein with HEPN domain
MPREERDPALVLDMIGFCQEVAEYLIGVTFENYMDLPQKRRALERVIELVGEAASRLSDTFRAAHPEILWREIIGLRNVLIHAYAGVDHRRVWQIATVDVPELVAALKAINFPE